MQEHSEFVFQLFIVYIRDALQNEGAEQTQLIVERLLQRRAQITRSKPLSGLIAAFNKESLLGAKTRVDVRLRHIGERSDS